MMLSNRDSFHCLRSKDVPLERGGGGNSGFLISNVFSFKVPFINLILPINWSFGLCNNSQIVSRDESKYVTLKIVDLHIHGK